jgi:outer membrane protein
MNITCLRLYLGLCPLVLSGQTYAEELTVSIDNPPESGTVALVLFDSANSFGDLRDPAKVVRYELDGREKYCIEDVVPGEYALMVYFDENGNDRIDKNFIGIPREPLGFSNRYAPKGPPSYSRAAFVLKPSETLHFDVELYRPLGDFGRLGVGIGVIARSSPYRDYSGAVSQVIPAITYTGERLQVYGPFVQWGIAGSGKLRLALTGSYRIGVYEENESPYLAGMGDREDTFMAGLAVQAELPGGLQLQLGYEHDILDTIGGGAARISLSKGYQYGTFQFSPQLGFNYLDSKLSNYDYGVPPDKAVPGRPAYELGSTLSIEPGLGMFIEITRDWLVLVNISYERLDDQVTDSPIVDKDYVFKGLAVINYVF